jgi:hypothetical protein
VTDDGRPAGNVEPRLSDRALKRGIATGAILVSAGALLIFGYGQAGLLWPTLLLPVIGVSFACHFLGWAARRLIVGKATGQATGELTKMVLEGLLVAVLAAFGLLIAGALITLPFQKALAGRLLRAAILLSLVYAALQFFIGAFVNTQIVVRHLRGRGRAAAKTDAVNSP